MGILSQEFIYQSLQSRNYPAVIMELSERGNIIDQDLSVTYAIDIFLDQFFLEVESADNFANSEILQDLDLLFLTHITDGKYKLKDKYVIRLIPLMVNRTPQSQLCKIALDYPNDPFCRKLIDDQLAQKRIADNKKNEPSITDKFIATRSIKRRDFEARIREKEGKQWIKVFLRSGKLMDTVANHLRKLAPVGKVNITIQENDHHDLTIYSRLPFTIEETLEEVELTLENYFSRSPDDPIFKEQTISAISEIAYFQVLDYMIRLGNALESSRSLGIKLNEEAYRDYFVHYLDSLSSNHTATGETFHGSGKSDILLRNRDKEILMLAECKLWGGKAHLSSAVNQLFERYVTWRDGKAALLVFNTKVTGFTRVISEAVEIMQKHPLFVEYIGKRKETSHSFLFRNINDAQKIVKLELILFNFL